MPVIQSETRKIKQHLENLLKDSKILCELEPFIKKWSVDLKDTYSSILESNNDAILEIRHAVQNIYGDMGNDKSAIADTNGEQVVRKMKDLPIADSSRKGMLCNSLHQPENESENMYNEELETMLKSLDTIEMVPAVTETDIEEYIRGLGGQPDGPDLNRTNIREWKHIFMEQWLHMQRLDQELMVRQENRRINSMDVKKQRHRPPSRICHMKSSPRDGLIMKTVDPHFTNPRTPSSSNQYTNVPIIDDKSTYENRHGQSVFTNGNGYGLQLNSLSQSVPEFLREEKAQKLQKVKIAVPTGQCGRNSAKNVTLPRDNKLSPPPSPSANKDKHTKSIGKSIATKASSASLPSTNTTVEKAKKQTYLKALKPSVRPSSAVPLSFNKVDRSSILRRSRIGMAAKLQNGQM